MLAAQLSSAALRLPLLLLLFFAFEGVVPAQTRAAAGRQRLMRTVTIDQRTGTITRGPRPRLLSVPTANEFANIDLGRDIVLTADDIGNGASEWFDAGVKGAGNTSDLMADIVFAYCTAKADPASGGPGGSVRLGFYEGYLSGGGAPTTCVAVLTLTGLPGNTASSSVTDGGFKCYFTRYRFEPLVSFADGAIGYSWRFLDAGTDGLGGTWPVLACVQSCSGYGPDGQGMVDSLDRYSPPGTWDSSLTFGTYQSSMSMRIGEAKDQRWYVDDSAVGLNNGMSWANAFVDLQSALTLAQEGQEIWVAAGTYNPTPGLNRSATFTLQRGVAIYGGFNGTETLLSQRNPAVNSSILSGDLLGNDGPNFANVADNSYTVVTTLGTTASARLDGMIIEGANSGSSGAIRMTYGSPLIENCTIRRNLGGGIYSNRGAPTLVDCTIRENRASGGGGIRAAGNPTLIGCSLDQNSATSGDGGGLLLTSGKAFLVNTSFTANTASNYGGGVQCSGAVDLTGCTFQGNTALTGGGTYCGGSPASLIDCSFTSNRATTGSGGGGYCLGALTVTGCSFVSNTAGQFGGGLELRNASGSIRNCSFQSNRATYGGGLDLAGTAVVTNTTFVGNMGGQGGGAKLWGTPSLVNCSFSNNAGQGSCIATEGIGTLASATNSILWGNGPIWRRAGSNLTVTRCNVKGGYTGLGNLMSNPLFTSPTNLHLLPGSPCIDSGANAALPSGVYADRDGNARLYDDPATANTGVGTPPVDRGAYEFGSSAVCPDCDGDLVCDAAEILAGTQTDINADGIPDACQGGAQDSDLDGGETATLLPGGSSDPTVAPVIEITNVTGANNATVTAVQSNGAPGGGGYSALGKSVTLETSLMNGQFFARLSVPLTQADLGGANWAQIDLVYFNPSMNQWRLAVAGNTVNSPGHVGAIGDRITDSGPALPMLSSELGDYGVYWNPITSRGFVWANVDHTTVFGAGLDFDALIDCNQNSQADDQDIALGVSLDCNGNGIPDECDLALGFATDCNANQIPDACEIGADPGADHWPQGGDGILDACQDVRPTNVSQPGVVPDRGALGSLEAPDDE